MDSLDDITHDHGNTPSCPYASPSGTGRQKSALCQRPCSVDDALQRISCWPSSCRISRIWTGVSRSGWLSSWYSHTHMPTVSRSRGGPAY